MKKLLIITIISFSFVWPSMVFAYYESAGPTNLSSTVSPTMPEINQKVNITLNSYLFNLDTCEIVWKQDGAQIAQGIGQKLFSFTAGKLGQSVSISATVTCPNRDQMIKEWLFQTNDVEFLVTADTYVPPFYKGNSRISSKSSVKIIALPQVFSSVGEMLSTENLIYRWSKDGKAMTNSSGYGKNTLTIQANEISGTTNYSVEISSLADEVKIIKSVTISVENPKIIIYENKPLLGLQYQKGLGDLLKLDQNEITLTAEPFFFSNSDIINNTIIFDWSMNNKPIKGNLNNHSVTLRQEAGQTGETIINLQVSNTANIFSKVQKNLNINFGQKSLLNF